MDRGAWQATVHGIAKELDSTQQLNNNKLLHNTEAMKYYLTPGSKVYDFPGGSDGKVSVYKAGDPGSIPRLGRSAEEGNGNSLQYYCLENPMDRGAWQATVHGVAKSRTRLKNFTSFHCKIKNILGVFVFMYYLCDKYYKTITVQYCIASFVSWVPRLTLLDL